MKCLQLRHIKREWFISISIDEEIHDSIEDGLDPSYFNDTPWYRIYKKHLTRDSNFPSSLLGLLECIFQGDRFCGEFLQDEEMIEARICTVDDSDSATSSQENEAMRICTSCEYCRISSDHAGTSEYRCTHPKHISLWQDPVDGRKHKILERCYKINVSGKCEDFSKA